MPAITDSISCDILHQLLVPIYNRCALQIAFEKRIAVGRASCHSYTNEQFSALDSIAENPRILFKGPAGTGKTVIATEAVKRAVINRKKVIFICYNNLLSYWLKKQTEPFKKKYDDLLIVGTIHSIFLSLSGLELPKIQTSNFWQKELPNAVIETPERLA